LQKVGHISCLKPITEHLPSFVCAMAANHIATPTLFRSYPVPRTAVNCQIWQAARATTAAPTFFKRIQIGRENAEVDYIDGALGCNNPVQQVLEEAQLTHQSGRVDCILSVGTGQPQTVGLPEPDHFQRLLPLGVVKMLKQLATNSERAAEEFEKRFRHAPGVYFRLNAVQGMQRITLEEWKKLGDVTAHTNHYLQTERVSQEVDHLVNVLAQTGASSSVAIAELSMQPIS